MGAGRCNMTSRKRADGCEGPAVFMAFLILLTGSCVCWSCRQHHVAVTRQNAGKGTPLGHPSTPSQAKRDGSLVACCFTHLRSGLSEL